MKALHLSVRRAVENIHSRSKLLRPRRLHRASEEVEIDSAAAMIKRLLAAAMMLCFGLVLGSCGPVAGFVSDHVPHWAGGEPNGIPPRPGAPGYDEFIAHQPNKDSATGGSAEKANAQTTPSGNPAASDKAAVQGGLY